MERVTTIGRMKTPRKTPIAISNTNIAAMLNSMNSFCQAKEMNGGVLICLAWLLICNFPGPTIVKRFQMLNLTHHAKRGMVSRTGGVELVPIRDASSKEHSVSLLDSFYGGKDCSIVFLRLLGEEGIANYERICVSPLAGLISGLREIASIASASYERECANAYIQGWRWAEVFRKKLHVSANGIRIRDLNFHFYSVFLPDPWSLTADQGFFRCVRRFSHFAPLAQSKERIKNSSNSDNYSKEGNYLTAGHAFLEIVPTKRDSFDNALQFSFGVIFCTGGTGISVFGLIGRPVDFIVGIVCFSVGACAIHIGLRRLFSRRHRP